MHTIVLESHLKRRLTHIRSLHEDHLKAYLPSINYRKVYSKDRLLRYTKVDRKEMTFPFEFNNL